MSVVRAEPAYATVVAELYRQCFPDVWKEADIQKILMLPTTVLWVSEKGFLLCSHVLDEMEIISIGVLPAYRRQHFGSSFLKEMMDYANQNDVKKIFLEVSVENSPAQALYHQFGFTESGTRKNYYKTKNGFVDALCLIKQIKP